MGSGWGGRFKAAGIAALGVVSLGLATAPSSLAFSCKHRLDKFNRPDSSTLGPAWRERDPGIEIQNHRAYNPAFSPALATFKGAKSHSACVDVYANADATQYVAIVLGYKNLKNNIFIKVQDNSMGGSFDTAFAYRGNDGAPLVSDYTAPLTPFTSAVIFVSWRGSTVKLEMSIAFNKEPQQKVAFHGVSTAGLGKRIGLGVFDGAYADNFAIP